MTREVLLSDHSSETEIYADVIKEELILLYTNFCNCANWCARVAAESLMLRGRGEVKLVRDHAHASMGIVNLPGWQQGEPGLALL